MGVLNLSYVLPTQVTEISSLRVHALAFGAGARHHVAAINLVNDNCANRTPLVLFSQDCLLSQLVHLIIGKLAQFEIIAAYNGGIMKFFAFGAYLDCARVACEYRVHVWIKKNTVAALLA